MAIKLTIGEDSQIKILKQILQQGAEFRQALNSLKEQLLMTATEIKTAIATEVGNAKAAIAAALAKEKAEVSAQIKALQDQIAAGSVITAADLDEIVAGVRSIGTTAVAGVDTISQEDGATQAGPAPTA